MERLTLSPEQQTIVDNWRAENNVQMSDHVVDGTNLVVDDHLQIDNSWLCVVLAGENGDGVNAFVPEWGDFIMPIDLVDYITDRAGPNGQTMPIYDAVEPPQAMSAARVASGATPNPKDAARDVHAHRRDRKTFYRDLIKAAPSEEARRTLRSLLVARGLVGKDTP
jgi:hypothetical protein